MNGAYAIGAQATASNPNAIAIGAQAIGTYSINPIAKRYCFNCGKDVSVKIINNLCTECGFCLAHLPEPEFICPQCIIPQKLMLIEKAYKKINEELGKIFGQDVPKLLMFLNGRVQSKYLIAEILAKLPWAKEFSFGALFRIVNSSSRRDN